MAKRYAAPEPNDSDRIEGFTHPSETFSLLDQEAPLGAEARPTRGGRPPGAWLITGAPGTGKATLAYRIARYLLAHGATAQGAEDLSVPRGDPAARPVMAPPPPGLLILKRAINPRTGKLMTVLSVDEIRRLSDFFGMTSGAGGWRGGHVDNPRDIKEKAAKSPPKMMG